MKQLSLRVLFIFISLSAISQPVQDRNQALRQRLQDLVQEGDVAGIVVGLYENGKAHYYTYGQANKAKNVPMQAEILFEIGSITKTFTTLVAQRLVEEGLVRWDDPVNKYLPDSLAKLEKEGKAVTLQHLAMHVAGLPRMPDNHKPQDANDPYADYTIQNLYTYLNKVPLQTVPGATVDYSNTGIALLGQALGNAAGKPYQRLVQEKVLNPLGLKSAQFEEPYRTFTMAQGYADNQPVSLWHAPIMSPAGFLDMHAKDLMSYLEAQMGVGNKKLYASMRKTQQPQKQDKQDSFVGLGWWGTVYKKDTTYWHNGGTGGFRTFAGFIPAQKKAVVVLTNSVYNVDPLGDFALGLTDSLPAFQKQIKLPKETLQQYTGTYALTPAFSIAVTLQDDQLMIQATNQSALAVYPESPTLFFLKVVEAKIEFHQENGKTIALTLHQNGQHLRGEKVKQ